MLFDVEKGNNLMLTRLTPVAILALNVSGASRWRLCPDGPHFHLSGPAYMYSLYVQKSDFHLVNMLCVVIVVKNLLCLAQGSLLLFCTA